MKTYQTHSVALSMTAASTKSSNQILILSMSILFIGIFWFNSAFADLYCGANSIPKSASSKGNEKVTICHFPPGNQANVQTITISTSALTTHCDHHDDLFASDGLCFPSTKWLYLNGEGSWNVSTGKPNNVSKSCTIPNDLEARIKQNLPEGKNNLGNYGTSASSTNVSLNSSAKVSVAYLAEGAGYRNSIAYFNFNTADIASIEKASLGNLSTNTAYGSITERIIFPNLSNDILSLGDSVDLGSFANKTSIGFTLIANGWTPSLGRVDDTQSDKDIFRTFRDLNTEQGTNNLDIHALLFSDIKNGLLILAFEDLNRDNFLANTDGLVSDNDFNDVVLAVCVAPFNAVDNISQIPTFKDLVPASGLSGPASWSEKNMAMPESSSSKTGSTSASTTTVK